MSDIPSRLRVRRSYPTAEHPHPHTRITPRPPKIASRPSLSPRYAEANGKGIYPTMTSSQLLDPNGNHQDFGETPEALRVLEKGWREKRRRLLDTPLRQLPKRSKSIFRDNGTLSQGLYLCQKPFGAVPRSLTPPPTPPVLRSGNTAPLQPELGLESAHTTCENRKSEGGNLSIQLLPILRDHLHPTSGPVPITPGCKMTIHVFPKESIQGLSLSTSEATIRVHPSGKTMEILPGGKGGTARHARHARFLALSKCETWSKDDRKTWKTIWDIVEGYKRVTPRVKLWHNLGRLVVTCSNPPDIILSFDLIEDFPMSTKVSPQHYGKRSQVKVTYSRIKRCIRIDLSASSTGRPSESFRSKRIVSLQDTMGPLPMSSSGDVSILALTGLQAHGVCTQAWAKGEKEAVRRIWHLREEWERY